VEAGEDVTGEEVIVGTDIGVEAGVEVGATVGIGVDVGVRRVA